MKKELEQLIKIKVAISLNRLLERNSEHLLTDDKNNSTPTSYSQIGDSAEIRKATVSDIFNAKSIPRVDTLVLIIESMGYSIMDFSNEYSSITNSEIIAFKESKF